MSGNSAQRRKDKRKKEFGGGRGAVRGMGGTAQPVDGQEAAEEDEPSEEEMRQARLALRASAHDSAPLPDENEILGSKDVTSVKEGERNKGENPYHQEETSSTNINLSGVSADEADQIAAEAAKIESEQSAQGSEPPQEVAPPTSSAAADVSPRSGTLPGIGKRPVQIPPPRKPPVRTVPAAPAIAAPAPTPENQKPESTSTTEEPQGDDRPTTLETPASRRTPATTQEGPMSVTKKQLEDAAEKKAAEAAAEAKRKQAEAQAEAERARVASEEARARAEAASKYGEDPQDELESRLRQAEADLKEERIRREEAETQRDQLDWENTGLRRQTAEAERAAAEAPSREVERVVERPSSFGGWQSVLMAILLGIIAFGLLLLAVGYWRNPRWYPFPLLLPVPYAVTTEEEVEPQPAPVVQPPLTVLRNGTPPWTWGLPVVALQKGANAMTAANFWAFTRMVAPANTNPPWCFVPLDVDVPEEMPFVHCGHGSPPQLTCEGGKTGYNYMPVYGENGQLLSPGCVIEVP